MAIDTQPITTAPVNRRGGQESYLLLTTGRFGSRGLSVTWVEGAPGSEQPRHVHEESEQVYIIVRGRGLMKAGTEQQSVSAGTLVFIPPGTPHAIENTGDEPLVFVSAASPPFESESLAPEMRYREQE